MLWTWLSLLFAAPTLQQGSVLDHSKLDLRSFPLGTSRGDGLGASVAGLGDRDGNGQLDFAIGAPRDGVHGAGRGTVWIVHTGPGSVSSHRRVDGGSSGLLDNGDGFGASLTSLGDFDGDGVVDLAVGTTGDDDGGTDRGAVWILLLNPDGGVRQARKISAQSGGFTGALDNGDAFGTSVAFLGDVDGDSVGDLAVGAQFDDDGAAETGAVWILFLHADGTVKSHGKISRTSGGFSGDIDANDRFGSSIVRLPDMNGDGIPELVVGAPRDDDGQLNRGAIWVLFPTAGMAVQSFHKISSLPLYGESQFGASVTPVGDLDGDAIVDLAVGAPFDERHAFAPDSQFGSVWILRLNSSGGIKDYTRQAYISGANHVGTSLALLGDQNLDGWPEIMTGTPEDSGPGTHGNAWTLSLGTGYTSAASSLFFRPPPWNGASKMGLSILGDTDGDGNTELLLGASDGTWILSLDSSLSPRRAQRVFGQPSPPPVTAATGLGDLDGDGLLEIAVGFSEDGDGGRARGAVWILFLSVDGTLRSQQKISSTAGGFSGPLDNYDHFGSALAPLGDIDGDGVADLAVGADLDNDTGTCCVGEGAVWILFLEADGTVKSHQKIGVNQGGFQAPGELKGFGSSLATIGDLDGNGGPELAVGAVLDNGDYTGSVYILFLNPDGTVRAQQHLTNQLGGMGQLDDRDWFGSSLTSLGDLDGDGLPDLAVGAYGAELPGEVAIGAVYLLFLNADGTVRQFEKHGQVDGALQGLLEEYDRMGSGMTHLNDVRWKRSRTLAVFASGDDDQGTNTGAIWVLDLKPRYKLRPR